MILQLSCIRQARRHSLSRSYGLITGTFSWALFHVSFNFSLGRSLDLSPLKDMGERDLTGKRLACHSMPMYHGMGTMQTGWTVSKIT